MEIGIYTFVENTPIHGNHQALSPDVRIAHLMEEAELADQVGLDLFAIGEHHRPEYLSSAPSILLSAIAARTRQIRLSSAVTVLGSEDPVRVFQQYSTLDLISGGRAEIMAGRGSFIESFPLFGYDLNDYDALFNEHLSLLLKLREEEVVDWNGTHRSSIDGRGVYPRPNGELPVWLAVGGTPQSAVRAGRLGLPMALGIIGGYPARFEHFAHLHREAAKEAGHERPKLSINSHGFLARDSRTARDLAFPAFKTVMDTIGRERGWPPMSRAQFDASCEIDGANVVGNPQEVIEKVLNQYEIFRHDRFLLQLSVGSLPHNELLKAIELLGTEVAPVLRRETHSIEESTP
ncbi:MAG: LLM class flavin-dependent oxidoreductase [Balneolaceae bacterium]